MPPTIEHDFDAGGNYVIKYRAKEVVTLENLRAAIRNVFKALIKIVSQSKLKGIQLVEKDSAIARQGDTITATVEYASPDKKLEMGTAEISAKLHKLEGDQLEMELLAELEISADAIKALKERTGMATKASYQILSNGSKTYAVVDGQLYRKADDKKPLDPEGEEDVEWKNSMTAAVDQLQEMVRVSGELFESMQQTHAYDPGKGRSIIPVEVANKAAQGILRCRQELEEFLRKLNNRLAATGGEEEVDYRFIDPEAPQQSASE